MTQQELNNMNQSISRVLLFSSDFNYLPAKDLISLITKTDRFQVYGFKRLGHISTTTSLVNGQWLNLNLNAQKILSEEFNKLR
ncbi:MAG TPA: hypothetical protein V6C58_29235 [Allocoleopsis sp.]